MFRQRKVVNETRNQRDDANDYRRNGTRTFPRVVGCSSPGEPNQEDREAARVERETDIVNLLDLLPAGFLVVVLWALWGPVESQSSNHTEHAVNDADVITPSPFLSRVRVECRGDERARRGPRDSHGTFSQAKETSPFVGDEFLDPSVGDEDDTTAETDDRGSSDESQRALGGTCNYLLTILAFCV